MLLLFLDDDDDFFLFSQTGQVFKSHGIEGVIGEEKDGRSGKLAKTCL